MNVKIKNGQREIKLDRGERAALEKARVVCNELQNQWDSPRRDTAEKAETWIVEVLAEFPATEPATT